MPGICCLLDVIWIFDMPLWNGKHSSVSIRSHEMRASANWSVMLERGQHISSIHDKFIGIRTFLHASSCFCHTFLLQFTLFFTAPWNALTWNHGCITSIFYVHTFTLNASTKHLYMTRAKRHFDLVHQQSLTLIIPWWWRWLDEMKIRRAILEWKQFF